LASAGVETPPDETVSNLEQTNARQSYTLEKEYFVVEYSEHRRITDAGWAYRTNDRRAWVIYQDPRTRTWHTRSAAIFVLQNRVTGLALEAARANTD
jgi:hypothetical protein